MFSYLRQRFFKKFAKKLEGQNEEMIQLLGDIEVRTEANEELLAEIRDILVDIAKESIKP